MNIDRDQMFKFNLENRFNLRDVFCGYFNACLFTDCTIVAESGQFMNVHRVILAQSSEYFAKLFFLRNFDANVVIAFPSLNFVDLENVMKFVYVGELTIDEKSLDGFMAAAETLQIKGIGIGKPTVAVEADSDHEEYRQVELNSSSDKSNVSSSQGSPSFDSLLCSSSTNSRQRKMPIMKPLPSQLDPSAMQILVPERRSSTFKCSQPSTSRVSPQPSHVPSLAKPIPGNRMRSKSVPPVKVESKAARYAVIKHGADDGFQCNLCQKIFATLRNVNRHHLICNNNPNKKAFKCQFCPRTFSVRCRCTTHEKSHTGAEASRVSKEEAIEEM